MALTLSQTKQLNGLKGSRPIKLSKAIALTICNGLSESRLSLASLCDQHPEWPDYKTVVNQSYKKPWLRAMLWEAREKQADYLAQNTIDLEQSLLAEPEKLTMSIVQAHKVVMDNRHWYTGKVLKRVYGDDAAVNVDARTAVVVGDEQIKELRSRLNDARALVKQSGKGDAEP
jgi:hypothetical protein